MPVNFISYDNNSYQSVGSLVMLTPIITAHCLLGYTAKWFFHSIDWCY